jgi:hypothetical protein
MVPGAFTKGTNHFAHSGKPGDAARVAEYEAGPYAGVADRMRREMYRNIGLGNLLHPAVAD